jgi:hypothetical protein
MKRTVYIETSIPSFYYETRKDSVSIAWRDLTRIWWKEQRRFFQLVTSDVVRVELEEGKHPFQREKIDLISKIELLDYVPMIDEVANVYIRNKLVPVETGGDAYHLAYASYYGIEFLITWNCAHLANPNKFSHIHAINKRLRLSTPILCTPEQLLSE